MMTARLKELSDHIADLRARAEKSQAAACSPGTGDNLAKAHQKAADELWRQASDLEGRQAFLIAGLPEDHGQPKPIASEARRATPTPKVDRTAVKRHLEEVVPFPHDLDEEQRQKVFEAALDQAVPWFLDEASDNLERSFAVFASVVWVSRSWHADRLRALEARLSHLEAVAAPKAGSPDVKKPDALAARIAELEANGMVYVGDFRKAGYVYREGAVATHHGAVWIALCDAAEGDEPGVSNVWKAAGEPSKDDEEL